MSTPDRYVHPTVTVGADVSVRHAAHEMKAAGVGAVVLVDANVPTGIVTDRDLALGILSKDLDPVTTPVSELAHAPVHVLARDQSLLEAVRLIRRHLIRRLPIVDAAGELIGILTADDLIEHFGAELRFACEALQAGFEREAQPVTALDHNLGRE